MSEILTQEEVDNLLSGMSSGKVEVETDTETVDEDVPAYDFESPKQVIRNRLPTFEIINDRFATEARDSLSNILHHTMDIHTESINTLKFSEFGRSLPVPTSLHVFRMDPLRGHALLVLESQLVYNLIDTFFGGKATGKAKIEGREFTTIESIMIRKVVSACLKNMENSWKPVEHIKTVYIRSEVNPQFAAVALPTDLVLVVKFEVELEKSKGMISMCFPYSMIEPIHGKLAAGYQSDALEIDDNYRAGLKAIILNSSVECRIELGRTEITGDRLLHLKIGDIIQLDQDADKSVLALVEDIPKFKGYAGIQRGLQAFSIDKKLNLE
ncbi:MAG TPA: flagellar motor switch protein FliM [Desulfobacterales bacterium]|nr:flagellar motor switch protein FliM [Desulfobacterales bacterium]